VALPPQVTLGAGAAEVVTFTLGLDDVGLLAVTPGTGLICSEGKNRRDSKLETWFTS
jgi:hypothetical protein